MRRCEVPSEVYCLAKRYRVTLSGNDNVTFCVKSVEHKGQKRKLLLAEDGTVYKVKRSKLENIVEAGKYI